MFTVSSKTIEFGKLFDTLTAVLVKVVMCIVSVILQNYYLLTYI